MKSKYLIAGIITLAFLFAQIAMAQADSLPEGFVERVEQRNYEAVKRYADLKKREIPKTVDYKFGMRLDVAKVIYMTPQEQVCGNMPKIMSYEDSKGDLHSIRYMVRGSCRSERF
ncbi:DUF2790 domain-containing protein [Pseudomonas aeruginosa]